MYDAINTLASKERDRQHFANLVAQHIAAGNSIATLPGFTPKPMPARRRKIDPETVLKRRRADTKPRTDPASEAKREADIALAALARKHAEAGRSLNSTSVALKCGRVRLSRLAAEHGIEFADVGSRPNRSETATPLADRRGTARARNAAALREEWP